MNSSDSEEENNEVNKATFRIRFTIGNSNQQNKTNNRQPIEKLPVSSSCENRSSSHKSLSLARQNVEYCDNPSLTRQNETSLLAHRIEGDHQHNLRNNLRSTKKTYRFIEPQNHKSALFVNLGGSSGCHQRGDLLESQDQATDNNYYTQRNNNHNIKRTDKRLFISPDLNATAAETLTPPTVSSSESDSGESCIPQVTTSVATPRSLEDSISVFELLDPTSEGNDEEDSSNLYCEPRVNPDGTMSGSCNFMHWMSATKRRASSINPTGGQAKSATSASSDTFRDLTNSTTVSGGSDVTNASTGVGVSRRASSSDGLNQLPIESANLLAASGRSASGNHLAIGDSVETVCESRDQTQTNQRFIPCINDRDPAILRPLDIRIDSSPPPPPEDDDLRLLPLVGSIAPSSHPELSFDDILQIGIDELQQAEDECRKLEQEAQYWEKKVEEMERKQFAEEVPRLLVEKVIKNRKELRDLDFQLYQHQLDSEESDEQSCVERLSRVLHMYDYQRNHRQHDESSSPSESNFIRGRHLHPREDGFITDFNNLGGGGGGGGGGAGNNHGPATRMQQPNSKVGSHIKPGQENTADILSAVPPSGSFQRQQYLSKASSGTDSSEYSQMPMFNQHHKHAIGADQQHHRETSDRHHRQHQRLRHHQQHQQVYQQQQHHLVSQRVSRHHHRQQESHQRTHIEVDACSEAAEEPPTQSQNRRALCSSPIRPNCFKSKFRQQHTLAQDSSSTTSSSSPQ